MMIPSRGRRNFWIYSSNFRKAKEQLTALIRDNYSDLEGCLAKCKPEFYFIKVTYVYYDKWLTKKSKLKELRKKDVSNYIKNVEDVVFSFLGVDDKDIIESTCVKRHVNSDEERRICIDISMYEMIDYKDWC